MKLFDLHCDTLYECYENEKNLRNNNLMIDQSKVSEYNHYIQFFALFCGVNSQNKNALWKLDANDRLNALLNEAKKQFSLNGDWLIQCYDSEELDIAISKGKSAAFLSIEGAELIPTYEHLQKAYDAGVRMITLSWNYQNKYATGAMFDNDVGLTDEGKTLVDNLVKKNIIIDVSHLSEHGFWDVCTRTEAPFVASHSNSRSVHYHLRNLTDLQFSEIIRRKGLCGINLYSSFLSSKDKSSFADALKHIEHFCSLGGEDCLALGCDFDGCDNLPEEIKSAADMQKFAEYMLKHNYAQSTVDNIFYNNANKFIHRML